MSYDVSLTPENERLRNLRSALREKYCKLQAKKMDVLYQEKNYLTSLYLSRVGQLQYELFVIETDIARLQMEMRLIQRYVNQNSPIDFKQVEKEIDKATEQFHKLLVERENELRNAHEYLSLPHLTKEEAAELKRLYHDIAKRLHPDLNPNLSEDEQDLFQQAQAAYRCSDLNSLRQIHQHVMGEETSVQVTIDLAQEVQQLQQMTDLLSQQIEQLYQTFPFTQREFLADEEKIAQKQAELRAQIKQMDEKRASLQQYINSLRLWKPGLLN